MLKNRLELIARGILGESLIKKIALLKTSHQTPDVLKSLKNNSNLHDAKAGKRCFILGNGPSLKSTDFGLLEQEDVFTCNLMPQSNAFKDLYPTAHFIMDCRFFKNDNFEDNSPLQNVFNQCEKKNVPYLFINSDAQKFLHSYDFDPNSSLHFIAQNPNAELNEKLSLCSYIPSFPTVIHTAICVAWYMGYTDVFLLGCDCTGFVTYANVYESKSVSDNYGFDIDNNSKKVIKQNMTSAPIQQELRWYAQIFDDYASLNQFFLDSNRRLINLTNGGVLNNIPRANYLEIVRGDKATQLSQH